MSDHALTKLLIETTAEIFGAPERKNFAKMSADLADAAKIELIYHPSHLGRELVFAERGCKLDCEEQLPTIEGRVAYIADVRRRISESPFRMSDMSATRNRVFGEAKPIGRKLLEAAVRHAEKLRAIPPDMPLPDAAVAWGINVDLSAAFRQVVQSALDALNWELLPRTWSMAAPETGFGWLSRAGCFDAPSK